MVLNALRVLGWVSGNWGSSKDTRRLPRVDPPSRGMPIVKQPLTELLKNGNFSWTDQAQTTFWTLKQTMVLTSVLALPNFNALFIIESDASNEGIGVVLNQKGRL